MKLSIFTLFLLITSAANSTPSVVIAAVASAFGVSIIAATFIVAIGSMVLAKLLTPKSEPGGMDSDPKALIKSSTEARKYIYGEMTVGGTIVFKTKKGDLQYYVVALCSHEVESIGTVFINDDVSTDKKFKDHLHIEKMTGSPDQSANAWLVSQIEEWTDEHRLRGLAYLVVQVDPLREVYPTGIRSVTAKVKGKKVYDPRTGLTQFSTNPALCMRDYILSDYGFNASEDEINQDSFVAAANICDEVIGEIRSDSNEVILAEGYTRYTFNGVIDGGITPKKILKEMLSYHGIMSSTGGQYNLFVGAYDAPVRTINDDNLAGDINCTPLQSIKGAFNTVKALYFDEKSVKKETTPQKNQRYITEDGKELKAEIALPFTNNAKEAQRICKIALEDNRQGMTLDLTLNLSCIDIYVGQFLSVTLPTLGLDNKPFMCRAWSISDKGVMVTLKETHESIWDWNDGEFLEEDPAPNTTLPSPYDVNTPKNLKVESGNEHLQIKADGTVISGMRVSFDKDNYYRSEFSYKKQQDTIYNYLPLTEANIIYIRDVEDGVFYDVRVRLQNSLGVWSEYAQDHHKVLGKTAKPTDVSGLSVTEMPDGTRFFKWNKVLDVDLAGYIVKYGSGGWDSMKPLYDGVITTNSFESNELPKGSYTFAIKAIDTSSNESENATFVTADLGDPRLGDSIFYKTHNGNWGDNLPANTATAGGKLYWSKETIAQLDAEFLTVDGWGTWTPKGGNFAFETQVIDLTQEISILPYIYVDSDGTHTTQMSTSNNNTTFTQYQDVSVVKTRYIKFKITFTNTSSVSDIVVNLTGKSKELILQDLDTTTLTYNGGIILPIRGFNLIGNITVVMQNVGPGFSYDVITKNPPVIKIYDSNGARADAIIDVSVRGL